MTEWDAQLGDASDAWRRWCRMLEETGIAALEKTMTHDEVDLAEGLRHLSRIARLALANSMENQDSADPYLWPALDPHTKMGGDNPQGLYLSGPINGTDTFRLSGLSGTARWASILVGRTPAGVMAGHPPFGEALFSPDLVIGEDGSFEVFISPDMHGNNTIRTDEYSGSLLVRQFFPAPDDVVPMTLMLENLTNPGPARTLTLADSVTRIDAAAMRFAVMVPLMQSELLAKGEAKNVFETDIGSPTSNFGGVPGGNAVTARWRLDPGEALVVQVTPPSVCAYWDVQVGNAWYESFDYRTHFVGLTCEQASVSADGSVSLVVSQDDPGTANWLECVDHREGHIAIRWQLSNGDLPLPTCTVMPTSKVLSATGLPAVGADERAAARAFLRDSVDARFQL